MYPVYSVQSPPMKATKLQLKITYTMIDQYSSYQLAKKMDPFPEGE